MLPVALEEVHLRGSEDGDSSPEWEGVEGGGGDTSRYIPCECVIRTISLSGLSAFGTGQEAEQYSGYSPFHTLVAAVEVLSGSHFNNVRLRVRSLESHVK